jgi:hypothetical protein
MVVSGLVKPVGLRVRTADQQAIVLQKDGKIIAIDLAASTMAQVGQVPSNAAGLELSADGKTAYVVSGAWGLVSVELGVGVVQPLMRRLAKAERVIRNPLSDHLLIAESRAPGRLFDFTVSPRHADITARGLSDVRGVLVESATGRVIAAELTGGGRLVEPTPSGASTVIVSGLGKPIDLAWLDAAEQRVLLADAAGARVTLVDLTQPAAALVDAFTGIGDLWGGAAGKWESDPHRRRGYAAARELRATAEGPGDGRSAGEHAVSGGLGSRAGADQRSVDRVRRSRVHRRAP